MLSLRTLEWLRSRPQIEVDEKFFDLHFDANVKGVFLQCRRDYRS